MFIPRLEPTGRYDVDRTAEERFKVVLNPHEIEKAGPGLELNEEIHVAARAIIASRNGAKNGDAARMMTRRDGTNLAATLLHHLQPGSHGGKPTSALTFHAGMLH